MNRKTELILGLIFSFIIPPIAVLIVEGADSQLVINLLLLLIFWPASIVHAVYIVCRGKKNNYNYGSYPPPPNNYHPPVNYASSSQYTDQTKGDYAQSFGHYNAHPEPYHNASGMQNQMTTVQPVHQQYVPQDTSKQPLPGMQHPELPEHQPPSYNPTTHRRPPPPE